jgi:hypothetical protein
VMLSNSSSVCIEFLTLCDFGVQRDSLSADDHGALSLERSVLRHHD